MKRVFIIVTAVLLSAILTGQENKIGISFFQNYSTFRFIDSGGEKDDLKFTIKSGYGLVYRKDFDKPLFLEGGIEYNNKGATSSLDLTRLDWSFHYVNADLSLGFRFLPGRFSPELAAGLYSGWLFRADQVIGSSYYNLLKQDIVNVYDLGVRFSGGFQYRYSDTGSLLLRVNESMGLMQLEKGDSDQLMFNRTFSIQLGMFFTINKD